MVMRILNTPGETRPWFIRAPVTINIEDWMKKNETDPMPKIDPNWKPTEENLNLRVVPAEEYTAIRPPDELKERLKFNNAEDLASGLSEEQQWTLVETMDSLEESMETLSRSPWSLDYKVCGAVYGQNLAKIDFACRILGSEWKDKLEESLDWFAKRTILAERNMFQIHPESADYQSFAKLFQQVGNFADTGSGEYFLGKPLTELRLYADINADALEFKKSLQESLSQLRWSLGNKHEYKSTRTGFEEIEYEPMMINDWDKYFSKLISHNAGPANLSAYLLRCDVIA